MGKKLRMAPTKVSGKAFCSAQYWQGVGCGKDRFVARFWSIGEDRALQWLGTRLE